MGIKSALREMGRGVFRVFLFFFCFSLRCTGRWMAFMRASLYSVLHFFLIWHNSRYKDPPRAIRRIKFVQRSRVEQPRHPSRGVSMAIIMYVILRLVASAAVQERENGSAAPYRHAIPSFGAGNESGTVLFRPNRPPNILSPLRYSDDYPGLSLLVCLLLHSARFNSSQ